MPCKVYAPPTGIEPIPIGDWQNWQKHEKRYTDDLNKWCKRENPSGKLVGEIVRFPVADGFAAYMVLRLRPLELIHMEIGDAWNFQYIERLTVKDIRKQVQHNQFLASR
ncbi:MAG: hypothetical protein HOJ16_05400 [Candidatus Peribacter sp.]|jgi:hypothetical protein|nr:hypothetical protein [Candidatus Peribacter sp.]